MQEVPADYEVVEDYAEVTSGVNPMATVTITLTDDADTLHVVIESEPPFPGPASDDESLTAAQGWGLELIEHLNKELKP